MAHLDGEPHVRHSQPNDLRGERRASLSGGAFACAHLTYMVSCPLSPIISHLNYWDIQQAFYMGFSQTIIGSTTNSSVTLSGTINVVGGVPINLPSPATIHPPLP